MHTSHPSSGLSRRDFLRTGSLSAGAAALSLSGANAAGREDRQCIFLMLVGGPSQIDTWDPKPDAPSNVRGPFSAIATRVPGIRLAEPFPLMARSIEQFAIVRSLHHAAAPIHETGHQLVQTGRLFRGGIEQPHYGAVVSHLASQPSNAHPFVVLPGPIGHTGVSVSHGQGAAWLGTRHEPSYCSQFDLNSESAALRDRYGRNRFGEACLQARRLIEQGTRFVTVNMFDTVFNEITWDCHADGGSLPATLDDYRDTLGPMFDRAFTALLEDLRQRGLLSSTLVVATGEFGRTPQLNPRGGRDHWPGVWSALLAGAGVRGGQVVGASDRLGGEPKDRPVTPAELAATIYHALGLNPASQLSTPAGQLMPLADAEPIRELFGS